MKPNVFHMNTHIIAIIILSDIPIYMTDYSILDIPIYRTDYSILEISIYRID